MWAISSILCRHQQSVRQYNTPAAVIELWNSLLKSGADQHSPPDAQAKLQGKWEAAEALIKDQLRAFQGHVDGALVPEQVHRNLMAFYRQLRPEDRPPFLQLLATNLGVQEPEISSAVKHWQQITTRDVGTSAPGSSIAFPAKTEVLLRAADRLRSACQPLYAQLLGPISREPDGIAFLVTLRDHTRDALTAQPSLGATLRALDTTIKQALHAWFTPSLLQLRQLTWHNTPAHLLDKLIQYEAVHPVKDWQDLRTRLGPDRRVHAYFHPCLPEEPLVILHAALVHHIPSAMSLVLPPDGPQHLSTQTHLPGPHQAGAVAPGSAPGRDVSAPETTQQEPTVAVFYSISSTQPGLAGVDLGHFLISDVARKVQAEVSSIKRLVTLSPVPGFRAWLHAKLAALALEQQQQSQAGRLPTGQPPHTSDDRGAEDEQQSVKFVGIKPGDVELLPIIRPDEAQQMMAAAPQLLSKSDLGKLAAAGSSPPVCLALLLEAGASTQGPLVSMLQQLLLRCAARYLVLERRRSLALDPVAHFHLRNGAALLRINARSDTSPQGHERSFGIMANYEYVLDKACSHNRLYLVDHEIQVSPRVRQLLEG